MPSAGDRAAPGPRTAVGPASNPAGTAERERDALAAREGSHGTVRERCDSAVRALRDCPAIPTSPYPGAITAALFGAQSLSRMGRPRTLVASRLHPDGPP